MNDNHIEDPNQVDITAASIRQISMLTGIDRNRISKLLREANLPWTGGPKNARCYAVAGALEVLFGRPKELSPADQRNLAQAEESRARTSIMKREYIPIPEATEANELFLSRVREIIDESDFPREVKARIVDLWRERLMAGYDNEEDLIRSLRAHADQMEAEAKKQ